MNRLTQLAVTATAIATAGIAAAPGASAAPPGDPETVRTANPAHACAAVPGTLAQFGITADDFDYVDCVRELAGRVPLTVFGGDAYARCVELEAGVETPFGFMQITYPYTFHAEPGDPFPNLRAHTREQCARALWTFHKIESYLVA